MVLRIIVFIFVFMVGFESFSQKPNKPSWPPEGTYKGPPPPPTPIDHVSWLLLLAGGSLGVIVYRSNKMNVVK
ncbi:MAG: hypothetical protein ACI9YL_000222 [Luteibaculaceae bacterium]|jgi:hypothetical protein